MKRKLVDLARLHQYIIPRLAEGIRATTYLEIGVAQAHNLREVASIMTDMWQEFGTVKPKIVGVDIAQPPEVGGVDYYVGTSSDYLENFVKDDFPDGIDLVFIDGDHSEESARSDFWGVQAHVKDQGVILLHDSYPVSQSDTKPSRSGTVWKFVADLRTSLSYDFECATIPFSPGLTIIRKRKEHLKWKPTTNES